MGRYLIPFAILACGLFGVAVKTHPVDIWSASNSATDELRDHLKFRREQLIIQSRYPEKGGYHHYPDDKWIPFGPIFHLYLLNQIMDLQNNITEMKVPYDDSYITLKDICYQPQILPDIEQSCKIESIFQYFQNNKTTLNKCLTSMGLICNNQTLKYDFKAYDYHDHLLLCTKFPGSQEDVRLKESCLASFGGPVDPNFVLDGFNGTEYKNATTIIINFVVIDYTEKSKQAEVMVWEKAFKEYMRDYVQDASNRNLTITYLTPSTNEVGPQDVHNVNNHRDIML